jgi:cytochrome c oxidase assembly factor CtaG
MRHVWLLNLFNVAFLVVAVMFWWVALGAEPAAREQPNTAAQLVLAGSGLVALLGLGGALASRTTPVAPIYTMGGTHSGGAVLLVGTLLAVAGAVAGLASRWYLAGDLPVENLDAISTATAHTSHTSPER